MACTHSIHCTSWGNDMRISCNLRP
jgi:hypothetical protein